MSRRPSFDPGFSTDELAHIYSPEGTVDAMLEFEASLALALADAGIAPLSEAEAVASACRAGVESPDEVLAATWDRGTPVTTLREIVTSTIADEGARRWFHYGATSQDAVDTGQMIQAAAALESVATGLVSIAMSLRHITVEHRGRAHRGRTFLQDAQPTTLGFRTATWLDAVLDHIEDGRAQRDSLVVQLGGPVGTMEEYGDGAADVRSALAERLDLGVPLISWHATRGRIRSLAQSLASSARTMAKIATDVAVLASSEIAEIRTRSGESSSMPGKENPVDSFRAIAASAACSGAVAMLSSAPPNELDRGVGGWHAEWIALPLAFQTAGASIEAIDRCLQSFEPRDTVGEAVTIPGAEAQIDQVLERFGRFV
ncbi:MAG: lyase family protein [Acidimicrobiia bacterium]|jgi:3-carboxy-cis,cis-muconate cycloisomerase